MLYNRRLHCERVSFLNQQDKAKVRNWAILLKVVSSIQALDSHHSQEKGKAMKRAAGLT
jgi:hypothetical protein